MTKLKSLTLPCATTRHSDWLMVCDEAPSRIEVTTKEGDDTNIVILTKQQALDLARWLLVWAHRS